MLFLSPLCSAAFLHQLIVVTALILEEQLLGNEVSGECDGRDAEAGEGALEAVEAGEGACVSPLLTASCKSIAPSHEFRSYVVLSCPWVALGTVCGGRGELLGVETGDGGAWCHGDGAVGVSDCRK
jgi:hypothetical protein